MALIEIERLSKTFRMGDETIHALDDVSFRVEEGEMVSIIGPSGSGKSTLMNILGLLDQPTSGIYRLERRNCEALSDSERARLRNQKIGFVFQTFNLLPRASALRNVEMPLVYSASYQKGITGARTRQMAVEALKSVGLENRMQHKPNELSGGQRQRVAIARAIVNHPKILLADEPTGNLDSKSGIEILKVFDQLNHEGVTVLIITHDPKVASHARRVISIADGKIQSDAIR